LILTHNAPHYVEETLVSLNTVTNKNDLSQCEIIVLDNASEQPTKDLLLDLKAKGFIHKLQFSDVNTFFSRGNNIASKLADSNTKYYILLNSDIKILNENWLNNLYQEKEKGKFAGISYGFCPYPDRCDGFCFMIDKELYDKYRLPEEFEWMWSLTKMEAQMLRDGHNLCAYKFYDNYLIHRGGGSGKDYRFAKSPDVSHDEILSWFYNSNAGVTVKNNYLGFSLRYFYREIKKKFTGYLNRYFRFLKHK